VTAINTSGSGPGIKERDTGNSGGRIGISMRASGRMTKDTATAQRSGRMAINTLANGRMTGNMGQENSSGEMEMYIKDTGITITSQALEICTSKLITWKIHRIKFKSK